MHSVQVRSSLWHDHHLRISTAPTRPPTTTAFAYDHNLSNTPTSALTSASTEFSMLDSDPRCPNPNTFPSGVPTPRQRSPSTHIPVSHRLNTPSSTSPSNSPSFPTADDTLPDPSLAPRTPKSTQKKALDPPPHLLRETVVFVPLNDTDTTAYNPRLSIHRPAKK